MKQGFLVLTYLTHKYTFHVETINESLTFGYVDITFLVKQISPIDREMYFIDYKLSEHAIGKMDEIFKPRELEVILSLRQKMMETYEGKKINIALIASIYN